jgi:molecular chaperone DnaK (HSP70)
MSSGLVAASRRLPALSSRIEELIRRDEEFSGLCDDLAAAEDAMLAVGLLTPELRNERRAECEGWIEDLTAEIKEALDRANVIPLVRPPKNRSPA